MSDSVDERSITIARIVKTQGRIGEVAAELLTDFPDRFEVLESVTIQPAIGPVFELELENSWLHKGRVILKFAGVDSITDAERLVGGSLLIAPGEAVELPADSYFDFQLEGCQVVDIAGKLIGLVREVVRTGGTELLAVTGEAGNEMLIPFADSICVEVDVGGRKVVIDPPEGLLDL